MNETLIVIFAMQWTILRSRGNNFTKATSICGHSFELLNKRHWCAVLNFLERSILNKKHGELKVETNTRQNAVWLLLYNIVDVHG